MTPTQLEDIKARFAAALCAPDHRESHCIVCRDIAELLAEVDRLNLIVQTSKEILERSKTPVMVVPTMLQRRLDAAEVVCRLLAEDTWLVAQSCKGNSTVNLYAVLAAWQATKDAPTPAPAE